MSAEKRPPGASARPRSNTLLRIGLFGAASVALVVSVVMGVMFNSTLASSPEAKIVQAISSATVHTFVALFALAAGAVWASRETWKGWIGAGAIFAATLVFALYAVTCVIGFGASERISAALVAEARQAAEIEAVKAVNADIKDSKDRTLEWLWATYKGARKQSEKDALLAQIRSLASEKVAVEKPEIGVVVADVQAHVLARVAVGNADKETVENVQLGMITALSILLIVGEMLGFTLSSALRPRTDPPVSMAAGDAKAEPATVSDTPGPIGEPEPPAETDNTVPFPIPHRPVDVVVNKEAQRERDRRIVSEFLNECEAHARPGSKAKADTVYRWFSEWSKAKGIQVLSQTRFGTIAGELGADRHHDGRYVTYYGVARPPFALSEKIAA